MWNICISLYMHNIHKYILACACLIEPDYLLSLPITQSPQLELDSRLRPQGHVHPILSTGVGHMMLKLVSR